MTRPHHTAEELEQLFSQRIAVLDGAMGSMIQTYPLTEADFRGQRFGAHPKDLKGNNDLLCLTRPDIIEEMAAYVEEKKRSGTLPAGLAEQWDIQLRVLKDPSLPDMEVIGYPGFFKVAFSCELSGHTSSIP